MSDDLYLRMKHKTAWRLLFRVAGGQHYSGAVLEGASTHTSHLSKAKKICFNWRRALHPPVTYASLCTGVSGTGCVGPGTTVQ